jgi:hypothetical protein
MFPYVVKEAVGAYFMTVQIVCGEKVGEGPTSECFALNTLTWR